MRLWVTGAGGKLGAAVCRRADADGHEVVAVDRAGSGVETVELTDVDAVTASMTDADAVVHCAAYPSPENVSPDALVHNNVMSTFCVFDAADRLGIERVVYASSGSIYGTAWSPEPFDPAHVPVDEDSPLDYVDPYALSKDVGEHIAAMYARRGMTTVALRFHWILAAAELARVRDTTTDQDGTRNLWGYVELDDAARACTLAVSASLPPGEAQVLLIAAADTLSATSTAERLERWFPTVPRRRAFTGTESAFDCSRAARVIGWRPTFDRAAFPRES